MKIAVVIVLAWTWTLAAGQLTSALLESASGNADPLDQWTWRGPRPTTTSLYGLTYGNGMFVAVGNADWPSSIITSVDSHTWTARLAPTERTLLGVGSGGSLFVAVGDEGSI